MNISLLDWLEGSQKVVARGGFHHGGTCTAELRRSQQCELILLSARLHEASFSCHLYTFLWSTDSLKIEADQKEKKKKSLWASHRLFWGSVLHGQLWTHWVVKSCRTSLALSLLKVFLRRQYFEIPQRLQRVCLLSISPLLPFSSLHFRRSL